MFSILMVDKEVSDLTQHAVPKTERECFPDKIIVVYVPSWLKTVGK